MEIRALSWNLFHGRDFPPDPGLRTWASRLLGTTTRNATHVQVNRDLLAEFTHLLCAAEWDVALLQEAPPRWAAPIAAGCGAHVHRSLTSRNSLGTLRTLVATHLPDLIASNEGGSNLILSRGAAGAITERRELVLSRGARPERRTMAFARLASGLCAAGLHASTADPVAEDELRAAAGAAIQWSSGAPLLLGGDYNVRPRDSGIYEELEATYGLAPPTAPDAINHLLCRGLEVIEAPAAWPPEDRELSEGGLRLRLSDHAPISARLREGGPVAGSS